MQKAIRVMAIISAALAGLSLILLVASIPFQSMIAPLYATSPDITAALPEFPSVPFFTCLLQTSCIALLIICCGNKKGGIWLELLLLALLIIALPILNEIAYYIQTIFVGRYGAASLAAHSVVSEISSYCLIPSNWGQALACISCGMSIAFKTMSKKQSTEQ